MLSQHHENYFKYRQYNLTIKFHEEFAHAIFFEQWITICGVKQNFRRTKSSTYSNSQDHKFKFLDIHIHVCYCARSRNIGYTIWINRFYTGKIIHDTKREILCLSTLLFFQKNFWHIIFSNVCNTQSITFKMQCIHLSLKW